MLYGHVLYQSQNPIPDNPDYCVIRVSKSTDGNPKELYARFSDGTEKRLTGAGTGGGVTTLNNGLNLTGSNGKLGGTLIEDTIISGTSSYKLTLSSLDEFHVQDSTFINTGNTGTNKISGAGVYFEYIPSAQSIICATSLGAEYDTLSASSLFNAYIFGSRLFAAADGFVQGSILLGNQLGFDTGLGFAFINTCEITSANMVGLSSATYSRIIGTGSTLGKSKNADISTEGDIFQTTSGTGVIHSYINSFGSTFNESAFLGYAVRTSLIASNSGTFNGLNKVLIVGDQNNSDGDFAVSFLLGVANTFIQNGFDIQHNLVMGRQNTITNTAPREHLVLFGNNVNSFDNEDCIILNHGGSGLYKGTSNALIIAKNSVDTYYLNSSLIISDGISFNNDAGSGKDGVSALGIGSTQAQTYTGAVIAEPDNWTAYFENLKSVKPGGKITLVSSDSSTESVLAMGINGEFQQDNNAVLVNRGILTEVGVPDSTILVTIGGVNYKLMAQLAV